MSSSGSGAGASDAFDAMVLAPHPDDAELSCGGTILKLVAAGARVAIVDMTQGEKASRGSARERAAECAAATARLGVAARENLTLPDAEVRDDEPALRAVLGALRRLRPRLLLAPMERDLHPDHAATGAVAGRAFFHAGLVNLWPELGPPHRPKVLLRYALHEEVDPSLCVDISDVAETKLEILRCYRSQLPGDDRAYLWGLDVVERARSRDQYWGARTGCRAAEPFRAERPLTVGSLMALL